MTTTYTAQQVLSASTQGLDLGAAAILDSSAAVLADLDSLEPLAAAGKIGSVSFTDATAPVLSLDATQAVNDQPLVSLFQGGYSLSVTQATVSQAEQLAPALPNASIHVTDLPSAILVDLDRLQAIASHLSMIEIGSVTPFQPETTLTLTQDQLARDPAAIALIMTDPYQALSSPQVVLSVSGTFTMSQAVAAETLNGDITGLTVVDSAANLQAAIDAAPTRPAVLQSFDPVPASGPFNFASITLTDSGTPTIVMPVGYSDANGFLFAIATLHSVDWTGVTVDEVSAFLDNPLGTTPSKSGTLAGIEVAVQDTALHVANAIDYLEAYALKGEIQSITITDGTLPTFTAAQSAVDGTAIAKITLSDLTAAAAAADAGQVSALAGVTVQDSAANVAASLDGLESLAAAGKLAGITLTGSSTTLTVSAAQLSADSAALAAIAGSYQLDVTPSAGTTVAGLSGVATTVVLPGNAADYSFTAGGEGNLSVTGGGNAYQVNGVQALQFADQSVIVAATPASSGAVDSGNLTELYGAVFGREPDVGGLAFYQNYLKANPSTPLLQFAEWFLTSPEYTAAHSYAQTTAGDTQFITDSYQNLLHRTPTQDEIDFYLTKVLDQPGSQLQTHAQMLVYFSASTEFLGDVQVTAANPASLQHWLVLT